MNSTYSLPTRRFDADDSGGSNSESTSGGNNSESAYGRNGGSLGATGTAYEFHEKDSTPDSAGTPAPSIAPSPELARQQRVEGAAVPEAPGDISDPHRTGQMQAGGAAGQEMAERFIDMLAAGPDLDATPPMPGDGDVVPPAPEQGRS